MLKGGGERENKPRRLILMSAFEEHFYSSRVSRFPTTSIIPFFPAPGSGQLKFIRRRLHGLLTFKMHWSDTASRRYELTRIP